MEELYVTEGIEHDFGQRSMGYYFSNDKSLLEKWIKSWQGGGPDCYYTCTQIETVFTDNKKALLSFKKSNECQMKKIYHCDDMHNCITDVGKLNFFKSY